MNGYSHLNLIEKKLLRMRNWLCPVDIDAHHGNICLLRQPQTGLWFTEGEPLGEWISGDCSMLWIHAKRE
jgi:hypothetical protein